MLPIGKCDLTLTVLISAFSCIATPPNAMIFVSDNMKTRDLIRAGVVMKLIGIAVIFLASLVLLSPIFRLHGITALSNSTLLGNSTIG